MLPEQSLRSHILLVKDVHKWNGILAQRRSEDDHFEVLAHLIDELATVRPHIYENVMDASLDIYGQNNVSLLGLVKA